MIETARSAGPRAAALVATLLCAAPAAALETDQFYAWGRKIADSTEMLNAKVEFEIDAALQQVNRRPARDGMSCHAVMRHVLPRFKQFIFQEIELWAANASLVDRVPATPSEELAFSGKYLYRNTGPLDLGTKVPPSPTIELNGVRLGTDKLAHFFSQGWWYYKTYREARRSGRSVEEAEARAIRRGVRLERTLLGLMWGVFSTADLEANYQGMHFIRDLCDADSPILEHTEDGWRRTRSFDFRDYVTPEWDESYQSSIYGKRRWRKVRPVLVEYCPRLGDPDVTARFRDYVARDRETVTERYVKELVHRGRLPDPRGYSVWTNCPEETVQAACAQLGRAVFGCPGGLARLSR